MYRYGDKTKKSKEIIIIFKYDHRIQVQIKRRIVNEKLYKQG